ncbi:MAG TPA: capsule biosynthesis protein CapD [Erythrobacter sp.]|nr:capsule biosynthesis protein CapD [Sphingomonadaceae bacterium]HAW35445.1 capsule biosynthesis protein CapD [Erythrobacter sp.]
MDFFNRVETWLTSVSRSLVELSRDMKVALLLAMDAFLCVVSVWIAFSLRLGVWELWSSAVSAVILASLAVWLPIFTIRGFYRSVLRFVGPRTLWGVAVSCLLMSVVLSALFIASPIAGVPRTIGVLQPMVFATLLVISRLFARYVLSDLLSRRGYDGAPKKVLIFGAGSAGRQLAVSLTHEPGMVLHGYIDEDARLAGHHLDGVKVYRNEDLARLVDRLEIDVVLLAIPGMSQQQRKRIVREFSEIPVHVLTLPAISDLVDGSVTVENLREIEITDLLGRNPVPPNQLLLRKTIADRVVMVTGAGGSIGSELCRQLSRLKPAAIILVEMTEHSLYLVESELRKAQQLREIDASTMIHPELANIADRQTVSRLFERWMPDTVFHAAAYKHVPLVEENVIAGLLNNIFGTLNCALHAKRVGVKHFILVSTDKAVRPTNVMGASKRVCELVLQGLAAQEGGTRFAMVRFGNVLGSSGSVVPRFQQQIREGGPVTLTHRDVTRYFMTIPEAAQLVIQAGALAEGGDVFLLDMGKPVRIIDMARTMIHLSGLTVREEDNPGGDIEIREVGLRKGEKLYEELLIGDSAQHTSHPRIMRALEKRLIWHDLMEQLNIMEGALVTGDREQALEALCTLVPEFNGQQAIRSRVA